MKRPLFMNYTRQLMMSSAVVMGIAGIALTFLPDEIINHFGYAPDGLAALSLQVLGALYFAFAVLNWMARANLIGGIYSRPVAMGNFAHFFIGGLALVKGALAFGHIPELWIAGSVYASFATLFAMVMFGSPLKSQPGKTV